MKATTVSLRASSKPEKRASDLYDLGRLLVAGHVTAGDVAAMPAPLRDDVLARLRGWFATDAGRDRTYRDVRRFDEPRLDLDDAGRRGRGPAHRLTRPGGEGRAGRLIPSGRVRQDGGVSPLSRQESQAQTRRRLLDAAAEVFAERGFGAAPLEEIAERAGYSRGAVYSNFEDKDDLFLALLARSSDQMVAELDDMLDGVTTLAELTGAFEGLGRWQGMDRRQWASAVQRVPHPRHARAGRARHAWPSTSAPSAPSTSGW